MRMRHAAVVAGLALGLMSGAARAAFIIDIKQVSKNVVASGSGSVDLQGLTDIGPSGNGNSDIDPSQPEIDIGVSGGTNSVEGYSAGFDKAVPYGTGGSTPSSQDDGDNFAFEPLLSGAYAIFVPVNYVSESPLSSESIFFGSTIKSLGLTPGSYTYTLANNDFLQIRVLSPVPLPAAAPMFGAALMALGAVGYGLKRKGTAAT